MSAFKVDEKMVEDYLFNNPESIEMAEDNIQRQFNMKPYGIVDMVSFEICEEKIYITLVEIKAEPLKIQHISQLCRYIAGFEELFKKYFSDERLYITGKLVTFKGNKNNPTDDVYLLRYLANKSIDFYEYDIDLKSGIRFWKEYHLWYDTGKISRPWIHEIATKVSERQRSAIESLVNPHAYWIDSQEVLETLPQKKRIKLIQLMQDITGKKLSNEERRRLIIGLWNGKNGVA